ncbi:MAG TPA: hypothetical protein VGB66_18640, partial [Longimicrobium sp.]
MLSTMTSQPRSGQRPAAVAGLLLLSLAACGEAWSRTPPTTRDQLNLIQQQRSRARPAYEDAPSPEFADAFERVAAVRMPLGTTAGALAQRPDLCALTPAGDVYLAVAGTGALHHWPAGAGAVRALPVPAGAVPSSVADLAWQPRQSALYVLDAGRNLVRRYSAAGAPLGLVAVNSGQINARLVLLGDRMLLGGAREERPGVFTLLSVHDTAGRHQGSFLEMDSAMVRSKLKAAPPVLMAATEGGRFLAAEPSSPVVREMTAGGAVLSRMQAGFDGYRAPVPLTDEVIDPGRTDAWIRGWDRMVLLHAGPRHVFAAYQGWRGARPRFHYVVLDRTGATVAAGLRHD